MRITTEQTKNGKIRVFADGEYSFTVSGEDMGKILEISANLRELNPDLKLSIRNGNCKISIFGEAMRGCPGVACKAWTHFIAEPSDRTEGSFHPIIRRVFGGSRAARGILPWFRILTTKRSDCFSRFFNFIA